MGYKELKWKDFEPSNRKSEILDITIKDYSGQKIDYYKIVNKKDFPRVIKIICSKYGYSIKDLYEEFNKNMVL
jgi:hypothetical protein